MINFDDMSYAYAKGEYLRSAGTSVSSAKVMRYFDGLDLDVALRDCDMMLQLLEKKLSERVRGVAA